MTPRRSPLPIRPTRHTLRHHGTVRVMDNGTRDELLRRLAEAIESLTTAHPLRVAIDGRPARGKTTLADELAVVLRLRLEGSADWARARDRVGVTVDYLPCALLRAKDHRDPERDGYVVP